MQVKVFTDSDQFTQAAADVVAAGLTQFAGHALGVATGSTPLSLYAELVERCRAGSLDAAGTALVALDEYVGLGPDDPGSYAAYVATRIARPLGIGPDRVAVLDGRRPPQAACAEFEQRIGELGGVGVQVVGIGSNGHLAFNEPGTPFTSRCHLVQLSEQTRADNSAVFPSGAVPSAALTQGIATILQARRILLLARGAGKADAVARALTGVPDPSCPASALQLHPDVVVLLDEAAARRLDTLVPV